MEYIGKNGRYSLASQPMKQGGEGAIYSVTGRNDLVAKIYFKDRVSAELSEKLSFMANNPPDSSILSQIAWPQDVLRDANGNFVGFVMPKLKIDADLKDIYVYPPKKGLQITYEQKIIIAINICIVISAIHKAGYTFGDFNPLNIGVNLTTGHVAFLDTDSYHIYDKYSRKMYRCGVCLDGYVAPELIKQCKGTDYLSAPLPTFTQETDKFALAIHIFKLLMNGFTPFNGIKETDSVSQASPGRGNQAIEKDNYCFKAGNKPQSVATPDLSAFPPDIQYLFKRAFIDGRDTPEDRPSADEWYKALLDYKKNLVQCKRDKTHFYYVNDRECPYCAAEERYNLSLGKNSSSSQMTFSQPISVPGTSNRTTYGNSTYSPSSSSSPSVGSNTSSYVGAGNSYSSTSYKKKGGFTKKLIGWVITLSLFGALFGFVIWPKMIYPNMDNENFYTPEIVQTYCGTYATGRTKGDVIITIESCSESGEVAGFLEFIADGAYGKYKVKGNIAEKKNNGTTQLSLSFVEWIVQPNDFSPLDTMNIEISNGYADLRCTTYSMNLTAGENDTYDIKNIKTVNDLNKLSNSDGLYILKNDIDLSGAKWTPIEGFCGTLIGNGYSIKNLTIESSSSNVGFFSTLNGAVTNLFFENASVTVSGSNENIGILCGSMQGTVSKITVSGTVKADGSQNVGGIIGAVNTNKGGYSLTKLENKANISGADYVGGIIGSMNKSYTSGTSEFSEFKNSGAVSGTGSYIGGIMGKCYEPNLLYITEFNNVGAVSGKTYVGGIVGYCYGYGSSYIQNSKNSSSITAEALTGCIAGQASGVMINSCSNSNSTIVASKYIVERGDKYAYVGGYVGYGYGANNCVNEVTITYTGGGSYVGGIIGAVNTNKGGYSLTKLENKANISGADYVGGIIGSMNKSYTSGTSEFSEFKNSGAVSGTGSYIGGIMGKCYEPNLLYIIDMNNEGLVTGKEYVGGVLGYGHGYKGSYMMDSKTTYGSIAGKLENIEIK